MEPGGFAQHRAEGRSAGAGAPPAAVLESLVDSNDADNFLFFTKQATLCNSIWLLIHVFVGGVLGSIRIFECFFLDRVLARASSRACLLLVLFLGTDAFAQSNFYWHTSSNGTWSDSGKWTNDLATGLGPVADGETYYSLNFSGAGTFSATHDLNPGFALNQLQVDGPTLTLTGQSLSVTQHELALPALNQNGANAITIENNLNLPVTLTLGGVGNGDVTIAGSLSGVGGLTKTNTGLLKLAAVNTHSGGVTITAGRLELNVKNGLGSGITTLGDGTFFWTRGFEGNTVAGAMPDSFFLSGGMVGISVDFGAAQDIWITGPVSGPGGIRLTGSRRTQGLTLSGAKTFSGGIILAASGSIHYPNVSIDHVNSLGTGTLRSEIERTNLEDGGIRIDADLSSGNGITNDISIATPARIVIHTWRPNIHATFSGQISGGGRLIKTGPAKLTLAGANTFSGETIFFVNQNRPTAGSLEIRHRLALQNSTLNTSSGITIFSGSITNATLGGLSGNTDLGLTNALGVAMTLTVGANDSDTTYEAGLSGEGALRKIGNGTLTLSGTNRYSGRTSISDGLLRLGATTTLNPVTDVYLYSNAPGKRLDLDFIGTALVNALYIDEVQQLVQPYNAANLPAFITGSGNISPETGGFTGAILILR
ncbi:MAG: autotransporter-associated beta strand protein [Candidatus Promineifilaceae bacterium]